ncbi:hypothetical protein [Peterkaempfera bronchialis]|uniref:hypothetical protein n=1 Tax=Peterkaempfera bronchialis TaxID=2126346 RepID=UPI003C2F25AE
MIPVKRHKRSLTHLGVLTALVAAAGATALAGAQRPATAGSPAPRAATPPLSCTGTADIQATDPATVLLRDSIGRAGYRATVTGDCTGNVLVPKVRAVLEGVADGTCGQATGTGQGTITWLGARGEEVGTSTVRGTLRFSNDLSGKVTFTAEGVQFTKGLFVGSAGAQLKVDTPGIGMDCWTQGRLAGGSGTGSLRLTFG